MNVPYGQCHCGCGEKTNIAKQTLRAKNWIKGEPLAYIANHHTVGKRSRHWRGGRHLSEGYVLIYYPSHHSAHKTGYVREHIVVAESVLGHPLPARAVYACRNKRQNELRRLRIERKIQNRR